MPCRLWPVVGTSGRAPYHRGSRLHRGGSGGAVVAIDPASVDADATTALPFSMRPDLDATTRLRLIAYEWLKLASGPTQAGTMAGLVLRILLRCRRFQIWLSTRRGRVDDSAGSLLPEPACSELGYRWFDQLLEVGVADAHGVGMGARPEYYGFIFR